MMRIPATVAIVFSLLTPALAVPASPGPDWPADQHDGARTGAFPGEGPDSGAVLWSRDVPIAANLSLVTGSGAVFAVAGGLLALDPSYGTTLWSFAPAGEHAVSGPAVEDGVVVYATNRTLYALNATTGKGAWNRSIAPCESRSGSVAISGAAVFLGMGCGAGLGSWNLTDGRSLWSAPAVDAGATVPAAGGDLLFAGGTALAALNITTGAPVWAHGGGHSAPVLSEGILAVGNISAGIVEFVDTSTGLLYGAVAGDVPPGGGAATDGAVVYIAFSNGTVGAYNLTTRAPVWSVSLGEAVAQPPALGRTSLYIATNRSIHRFNAAAGSSSRLADLGSPADTPLALAPGKLFMGTTTGVLAMGNRPSAVIETAGPSPVVRGGILSLRGHGENGTITAHEWRSSLDGEISRAAAVNISTLTAGNQTVSYRVRDANGTWSNITTAAVAVLPSRDWPAFRHDNLHSGASPSPAPRTNSTAWVAALGHSIQTASSVVWNGRVFIGDSTGQRLYALDENSGAVLWWYRARGSIWSTPAVADGYVFLATNYGEVVALQADPSDGSDEGETNSEQGSGYDLLWRFKTADTLWGSPAVVNSLVVATTTGGSVYVLSENGTLVWNRTPASSGIYSSPAAGGGLALFGSRDGNLYALNLGDGGTVWSYATGGEIWESSPAVGGGAAYIGSFDGKLHAVNMSTGKGLWTFQTGGAVDSSPALGDSMVYFGSRDGRLYALRSATGALAWSYPLDGFVDSSPAVADGMVFAGSDSGGFYALNASTGALVWRYAMGSVLSSPAVADGFLFVGSDDGNLYAFGPRPDFALATANVSVLPPRPMVGQRATVTVDVRNIGQVAGAGTLAVDDSSAAGRERVFSSQVSIPPGGTRQVNGSWYPRAGGAHTLIMTVENSTPPDPNPLNNLLLYSILVVQPENDWPMVGGGPARTGATRSEVPTSPVPVWNFTPAAPPGHPQYSAPVVSEGRVAYGSGSTLYMLDEFSGTEFWNVSLDGESFAPPVIMGGLVYLLTVSGHLTAFDTVSGRAIWSRALGDTAPASPLVTGHTLVATGLNGTITALDTTTGSVLWGAELNSTIPVPPTEAEGNALVAAGSRIVAFNLTSGLEAWSMNLPSPPRSALSYLVADHAPSVGQRLLLFMTASGNLTAVDVVLRRVAWSVHAGGNASLFPPVLPEGFPLQFGLLPSPALTVSGLAIAPAGRAAVGAYALANGTLVWETDTGPATGARYFMASPAAASQGGAGKVLAGGAGLFLLNETKGFTVWNFTDGWFWAPPAAANDMAFAAGEDGVLSAFARFATAPPRAMVAAPANGSTFRQGESVSFTSASTDSDGAVMEHLWNFGDNASAAGRVVQHRFNATGTYRVTLTITDNDGLTDSASVTISVISNKGPRLNGTNAVPRAGDITEQFNFTVSYSDEDNDPPAYIRLVVNNRTYPMSPLDPSDANHTDGAVFYCATSLPSEASTFRFEASDGVIAVSTPPAQGPRVTQVLTFSGARLSVAVKHVGPGTVNISESATGSISGPPGLVMLASYTITSTILDWEWANITVNYTIYNITGVNESSLRLYSWAGDSPTNWTLTEGGGILAARKSVHANFTGPRARFSPADVFAVAGLPVRIPNRLPQLALSTSAAATGNRVYAGENVTFSAAGTRDDDGDNLTYSWNFDDGVRGEGREVTHRFQRPGKYQVVLTVSDGKGENRTTVTINVQERGGNQTIIILVVVIIIVMGVALFIPIGGEKQALPPPPPIEEEMLDEEKSGRKRRRKKRGREEE